jgi:hypothetical protein
MNKHRNRKPHLVTPVMEERIILVAYGEGSLIDWLVVHAVRRNNPKVEALLLSHREARRSMRDATAQMHCPDALARRLMEIPATHHTRGAKNTTGWWWHQALLPVGAACTLMIAAAFWVHYEQQRDQAELEYATLQARQSLAMIGSMLNQAKADAYEHAIIRHTATPLQLSISKGTETIKQRL